MTVILTLLFMSDLWFTLIDLNNAKHFKNIYKQRINVRTISSNKIMGLMHDRG